MTEKQIEFMGYEWEKIGEKWLVKINDLFYEIDWNDSESLVSKLNEQQVVINKLKEENNKLKKLIKGNVFGKYKEGSLADLKFKAIAYDDIVKLEMSYESEPKLIVSCKQGKKENVKNFCQMFIPLGVYYEIKEVNE